MTRIPLPTPETMSPELRERYDRVARRGPVLNIMRLFMAAPELQLNAFTAWRASGLSDRERELVILRTAHQRQSRYEWHQHVRIARQAGLSDAEIAGMVNWKGNSLYSAEEQRLLAWVDAVSASAHPSDAEFQAFAANRPLEQTIGVTYLITLYVQLAWMMSTFELDTEEPFVGWDLKGKA